jgi:hypothetical protein
MFRPTFEDRQTPTVAAIVAAVVVLWLFRSDLRGLGAVLWPMVVAGALLAYRVELRGLVSRVRKVSATGAEFAEASIAAQITAMPVDQALKEVTPGEKHPSYIQARVASLRVELNSREPEDQWRREYLLLVRLAGAQQGRDWYSVWLNIFASQLEALGAMAGSEAPIDLSPYYDRHVERREAALTLEQTPQLPVATFEIWAAFLGRMRLATVTGRNGSITEEGRGLLEFAATLNLPRFHGL